MDVQPEVADLRPILVVCDSGFGRFGSGIERYSLGLVPYLEVA